MRKLSVILFIFGAFFSVSGQKHPTSLDSINVFYAKLFSNLKDGYLHKDTVNWQEVEAETTVKLSTYTNFKKSLEEIEPLFSKIGATHCAVIYQDKKYGTSVSIPPDSYSDQWKKKYATDPDFEVKIIDGTYGYILMPALNFIDFKKRNGI